GREQRVDALAVGIGRRGQVPFLATEHVRTRAGAGGVVACRRRHRRGRFGRRCAVAARAGGKRQRQQQGQRGGGRAADVHRNVHGISSGGLWKRTDGAGGVTPQSPAGNHSSSATPSAS